MKCPKCGASESDEKAQYCPQCGEAMVDDHDDSGELRKELTQEIIAPISSTGMDVIATRSSIAAGDHIEVNGETIVSDRARGKTDTPERMDVVATRSKVAGRDIVDVNGGTYVAEFNINLGTCDHSDDAEFYLVMIDRDNSEQSYFACGKAEVRRKEKTWGVMLYDGRREVDLGLEDSTISSKKGHLYLYSRNGRMMCRDLGSRNGTYLNGRRVKEHDEEVVPGDVIRVGSNLTFRFEKEPNVITVKKNAITPISKELAEKLDSDLTIIKNGKLFLNGMKLESGSELEVDGTWIRLEDADLRKSIHMNRDLLGLDLPNELVRALIKAGLESSGKGSDKQIEDLERTDGNLGRPGQATAAEAHPRPAR